MLATSEKLYIDLLKRTLSFSLWPEPPAPIEATSYSRTLIKRTAVSLISKCLSSRQLFIGRQVAVTQEEREEGRVYPLYADTMIGHRRLENIQYCVETSIREGIAGDFIETGVWRGGACIFMRGILAAYGILDRKVFVADSFEGLPRPNPAKYPADEGDEHHKRKFLAVSLDQVKTNFERYGLLDDHVIFLKGWFKDTLPNAPIGRLALLRLDGDMYESTMDALVGLYHRVSIGGFVIVDDYTLAGCRNAIDDFRKGRGITEELIEIDKFSKYWRKRDGD